MVLRWSLMLLLAVTGGSGCAVQDTASTGFDPMRPGGPHLTYPLSAVPPNAPIVDAAYTGEDDAPGREIYYRDWLAGADKASPVGPQYDEPSCAACHLETAIGAALRRNAPLVARPLDQGARQRFGQQVNPRSVNDQAPEAEITIQDDDHEFTYPDGSQRQLRRRSAWATTPDDHRYPVGLRIAPLLFGWGLLELADTNMLAAFNDPEDRNADGISGRLGRSVVDCHGVAGPAMLGWKNTQATLRAQIAAALENDMGITTGDACATDRPVEISHAELDALVDYVRRLGVPDRRPTGRGSRGEVLFGQTGCANCHVPVLRTLGDPVAAQPSQLIWPYSDLMLHDMGPDLADPAGGPDAREWRTAPLWGIGIVEARLPQRGFLHDGRARNIEEAILWHAGEAEAARRRFAALAQSDREKLLSYVRSL
jgi:CxxC motif-containing protein (DUF1111 family)